MKETEKPKIREQLKLRGARYLSDYELVALTLRTGTQKMPVIPLAHRVTRVLDTANETLTLQALSALDGMGDTKAGTILAALELGRRYSGILLQKIHNPTDVYPLVQHYADRNQEHFICISLNGAHEVLAVRVVSIGILNKTIVHPREVFGDPLSDRAAAIVVCHNHPSGQLEPSEEDINITKRLSNAGDLLGINLLDHLILSPRGGYFSFVESGIPIS
ncbi:MAG TPA: DNA repair protein RadC [Treponema sp.]|nr:DNA repair protein RadC [Treponema sp.]